MTRRSLLGAFALAPLAWADPPVPGPLSVPGVRARADWKAQPPKSGGRWHQAEHFTLHHTAGPVATTATAPATLRGIQAFHMRDKGWIDLAYHVFVDADGVAWEGRSPDLAGDTATAYDPAGWFLVCALGNFEEAVPGPAQLEGIARVMAAVHTARGIPLDTLTPHKDLASTLCPGKHLAAKVADGSILARARAIAG